MASGSCRSSQRTGEEKPAGSFWDVLALEEDKREEVNLTSEGPLCVLLALSESNLRGRMQINVPQG